MAVGRRVDVVNTGSAFGDDELTLYTYNDRSEVIGAARHEGSTPSAPGAFIPAKSSGQAFDPIGNRVSSSAWGGSEVSYTATALNQYSEIEPLAGGGYSPEHDDDGNLTKDDRNWYTWNGENRLTGVSPIYPVEGDLKATYRYDYMGRRVERTLYERTGTSWTLLETHHYLYDGWNMVCDIIESDTATVSDYYVWGLDLSGSLQGAGGVGGLLAKVADGGAVYLYSSDANGNVGQMVDATDGTLVAHYEYGAFGEDLVAEGPQAAANPYRFSTKHHDPETGHYYYGLRSYNPTTGRWLSRDPIGERGGVNLYGFVGNDAIEAIDPFGESVYLLFGPEFFTTEELETEKKNWGFYNMRARALSRALARAEQRGERWDGWTASWNGEPVTATEFIRRLAREEIALVRLPFKNLKGDVKVVREYLGKASEPYDKVVYMAHGHPIVDALDPARVKYVWVKYKDAMLSLEPAKRSWKTRREVTEVLEEVRDEFPKKTGVLLPAICYSGAQRQQVEDWEWGWPTELQKKSGRRSRKKELHWWTFDIWLKNPPAE